MFARRWLLALGSAVLALALVPEGVAEPVRVRILLVNDWDRFQEDRGRGGFARLWSVLAAENAWAEDVLVVHAGDALSPSLLSSIDKGAHMVDLLNRLPLDVFVLGNHEFDFGPEITRQRLAEARFPVINSNIREADGAPFAGLPPSRMIEVHGFRFGFFGLTTPQTREISSAGDLRFEDPLAVAEAMAQRLRADGADLVVAVTHTGFEEDLALYRKGRLDLILTGHDHDLRILYNGKTAMVESGSQAEFVTAIDLQLERVGSGDRQSVAWFPTFRTLDTAAYAPDPAAAAVTDELQRRLDAELSEPIGETVVPLDSRRETVRTMEAAIGNLVADAMRRATNADVAIMNGGGIRGDRTYPAGTLLTRKDILTELPFGNRVVLVELRGVDLLAALENGVSQVEQRAGRFPQVSGASFRFDPRRPPGQRVVEVRVNGEPLDPQRLYRVATNDFLLNGGDGYVSLARGKVLIDPAAGGLLASTVMGHVTASGGNVTAAVEGRIGRVE